MSSCQAALMTANSSAGIATIQLRGEKAQAIFEKIFRPAGRKTICDSDNSLRFGEIFDHEEMIDQIVTSSDPTNTSIEIHCHGGPRVVQRLLLLLEKHEVAITPWQELDRPTDITEEIQSCLPLVKTRLGAYTLAAQDPGGLTEWAKRTIGQLENGTLSQTELTKQIQALHSSRRLANTLLAGTSVVLAGPANVGKSTLANALSGQQQSLVADMAGTTRDWTSQWIDIDGIPVELIDTAGRRISDDHLEQRAIEQANVKLTEAELSILVVEANGQEIPQIKQYLSQIQTPTEPLVVINKMDLVAPEQRCGEYLYVSATTSENLDLLRKKIASILGFDGFVPQKPLVFTQRQINHLEQACQKPTVEKSAEELKKLLDNHH